MFDILCLLHDHQQYWTQASLQKPHIDMSSILFSYQTLKGIGYFPMEADDLGHFRCVCCFHNSMLVLIQTAHFPRAAAAELERAHQTSKLVRCLLELLQKHSGDKMELLIPFQDVYGREEENLRPRLTRGFDYPLDQGI